MKPYAPLLIVLMLLSASFIGVSYRLEKYSNISSDDKTLYVGGSGPNNYTSIQDAIDNASDGDTVFVYNGTYVENLEVDKSISLVGEDRNITIIERNEINDVVNIIADKVTISCFTIQNSAIEYDVPCINISSNSIIIKENIIMSRGGDGIKISGVNNITISNNSIMKHHFQGIRIRDSNDIRIIHNYFYTIVNNAIKTVNVNNLMIYGNNFFKSFSMCWDLDLSYTECVIKRNTFNSSNGGISLFSCTNCMVTENNFMYEDCRFTLIYLLPKGPIISKNKFNKNYWFKPRDYPKLLIGEYVPSLLLWMFFDLHISIFQFDWNPAQEPYDIEV